MMFDVEIERERARTRAAGRAWGDDGIAAAGCLVWPALALVAFLWGMLRGLGVVS